MISSEIINTLSHKHQTTELNIRREYVQHLFLSYFYQQRQTELVYFKGGTALRIIHNSPRFSEDLDFSSSFTKIAQIEDLILATLKEIEREGIKAEIRESKETSGGYLSIIMFQLREEKIVIRIEISFRQGKNRGEIKTVTGNFVPPYIITSLMQEQLIAEKMQALFSRKKPRDFYDLYFILRANLMPPEEKKILSQVVNMLHKTDMHFEQELKIFLPKNHWAIIRDFRSVLEREIQNYL